MLSAQLIYCTKFQDHWADRNYQTEQKKGEEKNLCSTVILYYKDVKQ